MIKKLFSLLAAPIKALVSLYKDIKEKYTYTRNIKKIVVIKTSVLVALNVISVFLCAGSLQWWGGVDHFGEFFLLLIFAAPAVFADVFAILRGLRLVGGVDRLLEVLNAYRKGNLDTLDINVEVKQEYMTDDLNAMMALKKQLSNRLKSVLSISAEIHFVEPGSIERSQGKSSRTIDKRMLK